MKSRLADRKSGSAVELSILFGVFYFIQGIAEPTEGLISQPTRSLLRSWGLSVGETASFMGWLALPWAIKPVYGLFTDFLPIAGSYRKSYLVLTSGVASASLLTAYFWQPAAGEVAALFWVLLLPTIAIAFGDVAVDALMVETGQPRGLTGRFQSVQWSAIWAASILTGVVGGYLSQHNIEMQGFLICGLATLVTFLLSITMVREPRGTRANDSFKSRLQTLGRAFTTLRVIAPAAFLFLWNFNPFSSTVLQAYMTDELKLSEQFYGNMNSVGAVAAMLASIAYGFYCKRVPMRWLVHLSIVLGIASNLCYWGLEGTAIAVPITIVYGIASATATLIQLDLAARVCPPQTAGTIFALLMSFSNLGVSRATVVGGAWYDGWKAAYSTPTAFHLLVGVGALFTAGCWLIVPFLPVVSTFSNDSDSQLRDEKVSGD